MSQDSTPVVEEALKALSVDLLSYFERRLVVRTDAADLLGETMLQAWSRADSLPATPEQQRMWLFKTASYVLANHRRSFARRTALIAQVRSALATAPTAIETGEAAAVRDAVRRLPHDQRELVMLVHWDGFSLIDAASVLGINPSTARSRYASAKAKLQSALAIPANC